MDKIEVKRMYQYAKDAIVEYIRNHQSGSDRLPSEVEFAQKMGVSRNTIREAIKILEHEGIVYSRHGVGTFVVQNGHQVSTSISILKSITKIIQDHGYIPGTIHIKNDIIVADERIADLLMIEPGSKLLLIERVRTADDIPVVYVCDYLIYRDDLESEYRKYKDESLLLFLEKNRDIVTSHSICNIKAIISNSYVKKVLRLPKPVPLLHLEQTHYSTRGIPAFYSDSFFISEKFNFDIVRKSL